MNFKTFENLREQGLIDDESWNRIEHRHQNPLISIHWELRTLFYLGVTLLTTGLGILVYKNIDTIGHQFILLFIAAVSAGSFTYCFKHKKPFATTRVQSPSTLFDYVLLLGTISLLTFVGYLQFHYNVFGNNYGLATFIPMLGLFYLAYIFDHLGILGMAIVNLALWMGVSVTPKQLLSAGTFNSGATIYTYLSLGILLISGSILSNKFNFKRHFAFSYLHYGVNVAFISLLAGYFYYYSYLGISLLWMLGISVLATYIYIDAYRQKSFYLILLVVLYSYIAVGSLIVRFFIGLGGELGAIMLLLITLIVSAILIINFLIKINRQLKAS
ncbi:DUF2157 domain-containing protein [Mucilaginibacter lacusdianchii]|uniref:DUF2157 domain-containing protein n=1 Tax=Mucilaginibacter lacusdianchii TaxID=2684211 RepID=UPI00131AA133|nr:DUF2157 domain-containing protein [Mucilaginibacter sp. JXJ CY 39]